MSMPMQFREAPCSRRPRMRRCPRELSQGSRYSARQAARACRQKHRPLRGLLLTKPLSRGGVGWGGEPKDRAGRGGGLAQLGAARRGVRSEYPRAGVRERVGSMGTCPGQEQGAKQATEGSSARHAPSKTSKPSAWPSERHAGARRSSRPPSAIESGRWRRPESDRGWATWATWAGGRGGERWANSVARSKHSSCLRKGDRGGALLL